MATDKPDRADRLGPRRLFDSACRTEHELKLFCRGCNRCWSVDGNRLHHVDPVRCPGCSQQAPCFDRFRHDVPQWGTWNTEPGV